MASSIARPPLDPELAAPLANLPSLVAPVDYEGVKQMRLNLELPKSRLEAMLSMMSLEHKEHQVQSPAGRGSVTLSAFSQPQVELKLRPCFYAIHGAAMTTGDRFTGVDLCLDIAKKCNAIAISPEYGLSPEHQYPLPLEDCYAGIEWISDHAEELGVDRSRVMICGVSSGGSLAAGTALLCRDRNGPQLHAQCLIYPMLDDRGSGLSMKQYPDAPIWRPECDTYAWQCYLGEQSQGPNVSIYAAPGRAEDLSGLPPTYIDVGEADILRDQCVTYASKLWASGISVELHVWPGTYHGSEFIVQEANVTKRAQEARGRWINKFLVVETAH